MRSMPLALAVLASCASAWPQQCQPSLGGYRCTCGHVRFVVLPASDGRPAPAGRIVLDCQDGEQHTPLPVTVEASDVRVRP